MPHIFGWCLDAPCTYTTQRKDTLSDKGGVHMPPYICMPPVHKQHKESMLCQTKGVPICPHRFRCHNMLGYHLYVGMPPLCLDAAICLDAPLVCLNATLCLNTPICLDTPVCLDVPICLDTLMLGEIWCIKTGETRKLHSWVKGLLHRTRRLQNTWSATSQLSE